MSYYRSDEVAAIVTEMKLNELEQKVMIGWLINNYPNEVMKAIDFLANHRSGKGDAWM